MIRVLEKSLVDKISAGEVVERPASVVKELIENAIDAGADHLVVEVKDAGKSMIKVIDNGRGMNRDDLIMSYKSHATSKISSADELFSVKSLGFRGEALSSIAAVSNLTITSRQEGSDLGHEIQVEGGELVKDHESGSTAGTTVLVTDLFYNTPARRKHLKTNTTELNHIIDIVTRYALSDTRLSLRLISDKKQVLHSPETKELINKIVDIYGKETAKQMIGVDYSDELIKVKGLIGKPYLARNDREYQSLFVNGRYVKSQRISSAVYDAYHTLLFLDKNPVFVLFLEIDFSRTDVNVHPTKDVIRIEKEDEIAESIFNAVRQSFQENSLVPDVDISVSGKATRQYPMEKSVQTLLEPVDDSYSKEDKVEEQSRIGPVRILGQINRLYIICESSSGLLVIDQHAAQERVLFEKYMDRFSKDSIKSQRLLKPKLIELSPKEHSGILDDKDLLSSMGFVIEDQGHNTIKVTDVPNILHSGQVEDLIMDISGVQALTEDRIAVMACRAAVKGGDILQQPEMYKLIEDLDKCRDPYSCPHGRPTMINISMKEMEKKFKR